MAKIIWSDQAKQALVHYIENARYEFGESTARKWLSERKAIEADLRRYPTSFTPEALLAGRNVTFRRCLMMKRRFKLIYYYDEETDIVHIVDIWDSKMNSTALIKRIR